MSCDFLYLVLDIEYVYLTSQNTHLSENGETV